MSEKVPDFASRSRSESFLTPIQVSELWIEQPFDGEDSSTIVFSRGEGEMKVRERERERELKRLLKCRKLDTFNRQKNKRINERL